MRCDVNVSVRPVGREAFGTKVEVGLCTLESS
jgi:aspartyl-tRNA(Asn)/glutamyl-tRNA(Gln) amidotransferase subunit B